jgi:hypothetical protein
MRMKIFVYAALGFLISGIVSCGNGIKQYRQQGLDVNDLRKVAVLPLENYTSEEYADEKIGSLVIMELLSRGINVIEPGEVGRVLRELRVSSVSAVPIAELRRMGELLDIQTVMTGSVGRYELSRGITVSYPEVALHLMILDTDSGDILWSAWHTTGGASFWTRHFGTENPTLEEVSKEVISEAVDTLF